MREFETGATRDTDDGKYDYEAFLSPLVLERFAQFMHEHRKQADGKLRDGDNWQRGIPKSVYMKSLWRHFMDLWMIHRGWSPRELLQETCCAILFNVQGYLHEDIKEVAAIDRNEISEETKRFLELDKKFPLPPARIT